MSKVDTSGECWVWKGRLGKGGYGTFTADGKKGMAHRWILSHTLGRELESGEIVRHRCHTPGCVRPTHLLPGTQSDNMRDMSEARRGRRGPHDGCGHENSKRARHLCRKANGAKQAYSRGVSDYDRFMSYVDTSSGSDSCWPWKRYVNGSGYGEFDVTENGRQRKFTATRWFLGYLRGEELTRDQVIMHSCDRRDCVAPHHLSVGTHTENMLDMVAKGRGRYPNASKTHCNRRHEYTPENTYVPPNGKGRQCRACWAVRREEKRKARSTPASA